MCNSSCTCNIGNWLIKRRRGTRAVGIEYVDDSTGRKGGSTAIKTARASRLVVVSAGAFGSPSILERSGVGAESVLKKNNVTQIMDLPGVGENYMGVYARFIHCRTQCAKSMSTDHNLIFLPFIASNETNTMDTLFRGSGEEIARMNPPVFSVQLIFNSISRSL